MPKASPTLTLHAPPDYIAKRPERIEQWKKIASTDPRRVVRVFTLNGPGAETIEGDTALDSAYILPVLEDAARNAQSDTWKGLVNAGIVTTMCKCALKFHGAVMHKPETRPTREDLAVVTAQMYSPYHLPLAVLSNAFITSAFPATSLEKKMVDELRKYWSPIMQRIWSEPAQGLNPEPKQMRIEERVVVAQIATRSIMLDPTFLEVIFNPNDLTLAVIFRYWMHSTALTDSGMNINMLLPFISDEVPKLWDTYLSEHPMPPPDVLLPRLLLGASKGAISDKKKRTPAQTAHAIVSAFASHFEDFVYQNPYLEYPFFRELFTHLKSTNRAFARAVYNSAQLWAANASVLRRAGSTRNEDSFMYALSMYGIPMYPAEEDGQESYDALLYNYANSGFFDALEASMDMMVLMAPAPRTMAMIFTSMDRWLNLRVSEKTRASVRAQLPRPRLVKRLIMMTARKNEKQRTPGGSGLRPDIVFWANGAWQALALVTATVADPDECARRGCIKRTDGHEGDRSQHQCRSMCKVTTGTTYCSDNCLKRDITEHNYICGLLHVLEQAVKPTPDKEISSHAADVDATVDAGSSTSKISAVPSELKIPD